MSAFAGAATPLTPKDLQDAADQLGCDLPAVQAVMTVETGGAGGFLGDGSGRPRILFEAALFADATLHRWDGRYPTISARIPDPALYRGGAAEYDRLALAVSLDRIAALRCTSWGLFQVLASNWHACGFSSVDDFVTAMADSEGQQLHAFCGFCGSVRGLVDALRAHDWPTVARLYNGPKYAVNRYDTKLAAAYALACGGPQLPLRIGCSGPAVVKLQTALIRAGFDMLVDGAFGRATEIALAKYQKGVGLDADGIVGEATARSLNLT